MPLRVPHAPSSSICNAFLRIQSVVLSRPIQGDLHALDCRAYNDDSEWKKRHDRRRAGDDGESITVLGDVSMEV